jgi:hypothetical protein
MPFALLACACAPGVEANSLLRAPSTPASISLRLLAASFGVEGVLHAANELASAIAVSEKKVRRFMRLSSIEVQQLGI